MRYHGLVVKKPFGAGSKSEHDAVKLVTGKGEYVLRRQAGNPFSDPVLDALVGKTVECDGIVHGYTLIISSWRETRGRQKSGGHAVRKVRPTKG